MLNQSKIQNSLCTCLHKYLDIFKLAFSLLCDSPDQASGCYVVFTLIIQSMLYLYTITTRKQHDVQNNVDKYILSGQGMPAADLQKSSLLKPLPRFPFVPQEPIQWLLVTIYQYSHQIWHSLVRMNILQSTSAIIQHQQLFCGIITESSGRTLQINRHKKIKYGVDWKV